MAVFLFGSLAQACGRARARPGRGQRLDQRATRSKPGPAVRPSRRDRAPVDLDLQRVDAARRPAMTGDDRAAGVGIVERRLESRRAISRAASALTHAAALVPWRSPMTTSGCASAADGIEWQSISIASPAIDQSSSAVLERLVIWPVDLRRCALRARPGRSGGATARRADGFATAPAQAVAGTRPDRRRADPPRSPPDRPPPRRGCSRSRRAARADDRADAGGNRPPGQPVDQRILEHLQRPAALRRIGEHRRR